MRISDWSSDVCSSDLGIAAPSPDSMMQALAECWEKEVAGWRSQGFAAVREGWMARAHAPGTLLAARLANGADCQGRYDGLDADGALLLRLTDGSVREIGRASCGERVWQYG